MYNILIVDDEKIERSGIRMLLKRMGIELGAVAKGYIADKVQRKAGTGISDI